MLKKAFQLESSQTYASIYTSRVIRRKCLSVNLCRYNYLQGKIAGEDSLKGTRSFKYLNNCFCYTDIFQQFWSILKNMMLKNYDYFKG